MMSTELRRKMIDKDHEDLSVLEQCNLLALPRSTLYYTPSKAYSERDLLMMRALDELHLEDPTRGTRRMRTALIKRGYKVGRRHVRTLMQIMRIRAVYARPRTTVIDPGKYKYPYLLKDLKIVRPNQAWAIDITYVSMPKGFMYLTAIIDLYSRYIVGWSLSNSMEAEWVIETIKDAVNRHGKPEIINSDQGSQPACRTGRFTSDEYVKYIKSLNYTKISMDGKGRAIDNVFIERFWRTIKYDKLYLVCPENGRELHRACREFIEYYNERRDHSSLNNLVPSAVYQAAA